MLFLSETQPARRIIPFHPCLNHDAHNKVPRIHLPVAPLCNLACSYCERNVHAAAHLLSGPGSSHGVMTPDQAVSRAGEFLGEWGNGAIVGIAGPGDPLANPETFEVLRRVRDMNASARLCVCTNGLALPDYVDLLAEIGLESMSVTVNGVTPEVVSAMQPRLVWQGRVLSGLESGRLLLERQMLGITRAVKLGMTIKINTVVAPGINDHQVVDVAKRVAAIGALVFNPMPLIPRAGFASLSAPDEHHMNTLRASCAPYMHVFAKCKQCRADACGIPGKEKLP